MIFKTDRSEILIFYKLTSDDLQLWIIQGLPSGLLKRKTIKK